MAILDKRCPSCGCRTLGKECEICGPAELYEGGKGRQEEEKDKNKKK
jgi:hypothetical protein